MQMQMQELQIKGQDQARKAEKDKADAVIAAQRLVLDKKKAERTAALEASRIAAMTDQANARQDLDEAKAIMDMVNTPPREQNI
jgi:hypothetical protein